jgi:hypothetical protein
MAKDQFHWGLELWELGAHDYFVKINHSRPVKLLGLEGVLTASPVPNYRPDDHLVRQTLASLTYPGNYLKEGQIEILGQPNTPRCNQSIDRNLVTLNVKQTAGNNTALSFSRHFDPPIELPENTLRWHLFNESYRFRIEREPHESYVVDNSYDALNVEIHTHLYYEFED